MRILIDECVPHPLEEEDFGDHEVLTVADMGWLGKKNGGLLRLMCESGFDVFITVDQNFRYQQNLEGMAIAVIVLNAGSTLYENLRPLIPAVRRLLPTVKPGEIHMVKEGI